MIGPQTTILPGLLPRFVVLSRLAIAPRPAGRNDLSVARQSQPDRWLWATLERRRTIFWKNLFLPHIVTEILLSNRNGAIHVQRKTNRLQIFTDMAAELVEIPLTGLFPIAFPRRMRGQKHSTGGRVMARAILVRSALGALIMTLIRALIGTIVRAKIGMPARVGTVAPFLRLAALAPVRLRRNRGLVRCGLARRRCIRSALSVSVIAEAVRTPAPGKRHSLPLRFFVRCCGERKSWLIRGLGHRFAFPGRYLLGSLNECLRQKRVQIELLGR